MLSDETAKESAKAVQETAKATGTIAELAGKVGGFVSKVVGGASEQVGGILEDRVRYYRYKNLLSIADKVEAIHAQRKILGKTIPIPPRVAIPMLESAALEDDEALQAMWARLVANATNPQFKQSLHPGFIEVAKQLSPDEAVILNSFFKRKRYPNVFRGSEVYEMSIEGQELRNSAIFKRKRSGSFHFIYVLYESHCMKLPLKNHNNSRVYIDNLVRLRILELEYILSTTTERREVQSKYATDVEVGGYVEVSEPEQEEYLKVTPFGQSFIAACIADSD